MSGTERGAELTMAALNEALAAAIRRALPQAAVYDSPSLQNTALPAVFLTYPEQSGPEEQVGGRYLRTVRVELEYLEDYGAEDAGARYLAAADALDLALTHIPYADGLPLHTGERRWSVEQDRLRYRLTLKLRLSTPRTVVRMQRMVARTERSGHENQRDLL